MNIYFILILCILTFSFLLERLLDYLNMKNFSLSLPKEAQDIYDADKYKKSMEYYKAKHRFGLLNSAFSFILIICLFVTGTFGTIEASGMAITNNYYFVSFLFFAKIGLLFGLVSLPFSAYRTFVIEKKFGFNRTTWKTFFMDKIKALLLTAIIGGGILFVLIKVYVKFTSDFWWIAWLVVASFMVFITMFYTSLLLPIFNKLTPLPEGELRTAIEKYCGQVGFKLGNIFVMNGSKRSTHANAFFSGLGPKKKIVLYDTLIEKHSIEELVAVMAHEVGHYRKKHSRVMLITGLLQMGIMLFIFSLFIGNLELANAMGLIVTSFDLEIIAFGILISPLSMIFGIAGNMMSRMHEYEADEFAKSTYNGTALAKALKKLSADNLSNLTPHPAYVFVHYSHPTLLQRLKKLEN